MSAPEDRLVGNYVLGARLGRGGAGEVYAARHRFLGDEVAVKLLRADPDDAAAVDAVVAEATRIRAVEHPNVVRVLDVGRDARGGYLVMERLDGETLAARLARDGALPEDVVRRIGAAIADGMAAAHARGVVHRDLKPANVMLAGDVPTIVDFGIARQLDGRAAAHTTSRVGTPAYMAPEQLAAGVVAPAVDVWSLGALLFEAATGRLPFDGYTEGRCPQLVEAAPRAGAIAPVSAALDELVARCLAREPGARPTMVEVARALRAVVTDERVTQDVGALVAAAAPAATLVQARRRSRWPWAAAAIVIAGGAIAVVAAATTGERAGTERTAVEAEAEAEAGTEAEAEAEAEAAAEAGTEAAAETGTGTGAGTEAETETETETEAGTGLEPDAGIPPDAGRPRPRRRDRPDARPRPPREGLD